MKRLAIVISVLLVANLVGCCMMDDPCDPCDQQGLLFRPRIFNNGFRGNGCCNPCPQQCCDPCPAQPCCNGYQQFAAPCATPCCDPCHGAGPFAPGHAVVPGTFMPGTQIVPGTTIIPGAIPQTIPVQPGPTS